jgi:RNAse (barnase) inhibitor barstar
MIDNNINNDYSNVDKYFIDNINKVILIDVLKITKETVNKLDMLMWDKYSGMEYLPLILAFNNLSDITDISVGTIIKFPDIDSLLENIILLEENDDNIVQGINSLIPNKKQIKNDSNIALPKLNISLRKVKYDENSGIITY